MKLKKYHVVLIDKDKHSYAEISDFLKRFSSSDFYIKPFTTLEAGIDYCKSHLNVDVVFVGLHYQNRRSISKSVGEAAELAKEVAVIILNSKRDEVLSLRVIQKGVHDFLVKSDLTPDILYRAIRHSMEKFQLLSQIQSRELKNQALLKAITNVVWETGPHGEIHKSQPSWERYVGQTLEQACGFGWRKKIHMEDLDLLLKLWHEARSRKKDFETKIRVWSQSDKEYRHCICHLAPKIDLHGVIQNWEIAIADKHEEAIQSNEILKQRNELLETNKTLDYSLENLEDLLLQNANLRELIMLDIRAPLTSLLAATEHLYVMSLDEAQKNKALSVTKRSVHRIINRIDEYVTLTDHKQGIYSFSKQEESLLPILERGIEHNSHIAFDKSININFKNHLVDDRVLLNKQRFMNAFEHIVINAIENSEDKTQVNIDVYQKKDRVFITIHNKSKNIDIKNIKKIYTKYKYITQDHLLKNPRNLGIGIAITKAVMKAHGGDLIFECHKNKGSTFTLVVPKKHVTKKAA